MLSQEFSQSAFYRSPLPARRLVDFEQRLRQSFTHKLAFAHGAAEPESAGVDRPLLRTLATALDGAGRATLDFVWDGTMPLRESHINDCFQEGAAAPDR